MARSIREKDFLNDGDSKRKGSKVVKPVRSRTYSSKDAASTPGSPGASPAVNDVAHGVASITQKAHEFVSHSSYYKKEDLIVFDSDDEEDTPREPTVGREATKSLAELEQLFFRCANVMKADDIHLQMRNLHMIMAKQILKDMEYQIKYEEKKKTSRETWEFKHKVHMATFKRIAKPIEKQVDKKKKEKEKSFFVPRWMPDERRQRCLLCRRPFGLFNRRHHCRACGDITCNDCSKTEGPHKIRRCHECIRLGRTIASSMPPATPAPPTPDSFSTRTGPSHPSHTRTCYIHPNTNSNPNPSSDSSVTSNTTNRNPSSRTLSLPPAHVPNNPGSNNSNSNSNGTSNSTPPSVVTTTSTTRKPSITSISPTNSISSKNSVSGRERTSNSENFSAVPIAWGAGSGLSISETSKSSGLSNGVSSSSSGGGNNNNNKPSQSSTPLSSPKRKKDTPPPPDKVPTLNTISSNTISSNTISVTSITHANGKGGTITRPHSQSISVSKTVPVPWVPDEHRLCCVICGGTFHFFFRRHHCRKCGEVVCNDCSTVENTPDGERYCDTCRQETGIALDI